MPYWGSLKYLKLARVKLLWKNIFTLYISAKILLRTIQQLNIDNYKLPQIHCKKSSTTKFFIKS